MSFVLEYGSVSGEYHVSIDWALPLPVTVYGKDSTLPEYRGNIANFAILYPAILAEMLDFGALRPA